MLKGDAFNRYEVSSWYVHRDDRYVFSFVVGFGADQVANPAAASAEMTCGPESGKVRVFVFDREAESVLDASKEEALKMPRAEPSS